MISSVLFFFLKIALTIQDLLWIHTDFMVCFRSAKLHWYFDRDCTESVDWVVWMFLTVLIFLIYKQAWYIFLFICVILVFYSL